MIYEYSSNERILLRMFVPHFKGMCFMWKYSISVIFETGKFRHSGVDMFGL